MIRGDKVAVIDLLMVTAVRVCKNKGQCKRPVSQAGCGFAQRACRVENPLPEALTRRAKSRHHIIWRPGDLYIKGIDTVISRQKTKTRIAVSLLRCDRSKMSPRIIGGDKVAVADLLSVTALRVDQKNKAKVPKTKACSCFKRIRLGLCS